MIKPRIDLTEFFSPNGVAVVGRVDRTAGEEALRVANDERWGSDNWYLVNPKGGSVGSIPVYSELAAVPGPVTLAVISAPAAACADIVRQAGARGVTFALVFSAGFSEVGEEGAELERELARAGAEADVHIIGPNTNTNAFEVIPDAEYQSGRRIGVVSQSGHNGRPIVQGNDLGLGFTRLIPTGNEVDVDICDFIEHLALDSDTAVIAAYAEGFRDGDRLHRALRIALETNTPIVMMKIGSTDAGARMAQTHTGHMVGSDAIVDAVLERYGVIRVRDLDELIDTAALLARIDLDTGPNVALYSISGGSGTLMAESAEMAGVPLATLEPSTEEKLRRVIPSHLTVSNPIDNGGTFILENSADVRQQLLFDILDDLHVDVLIVGVTGAVPPMTDLLVEDLVAMADGTGSPIIATWNSPRTSDQAYDKLVRSGIPMFRSFRNCFAALAAFNRRRSIIADYRNRPTNRLEPVQEKAVLATSNSTAGGTLTAVTSTQLLKNAGISVVEEVLVNSMTAAAELAETTNFPVAMKIAATTITHKTDQGLVALNVAPEDIRQTFIDLFAALRSVDPEGAADGVLVQRMVDPGVEMLVGVVTDPVLGAAIVVGTGGIQTELWKDRAIRPLPIDRKDAVAMVNSLRGAPLLSDFRNQGPRDYDGLIDTIMNVAALASTLGPRLIECEINPVVVGSLERGVTAVDSLMILKPFWNEQ